MNVDTISDPVEICFNCKSYSIYLDIKSERTFYGIAKRLLSDWTRMEYPNRGNIPAKVGRQL